MILVALRAALRAWWRRHVVDDDPSPEYSRLDRLDGLR